MALLDAALFHADNGYWVFPLKPGSKEPRTRNGVYDATLDKNQITKWWMSGSRSNIGIATGHDGLVVVDIDRKNGVDGLKTWDDLCALHWDWPDTYRVRTPTGGLHLYMRASPDQIVLNTAGKLGPGVDTRSIGGYVVAPPSTCKDGEYEIEISFEVAPVPRWLSDALEGPSRPSEHVSAPGIAISPAGRSYGRSALLQELGRLATATEGERNHTLNTVALKLYSLQLGDEISDPTEQLTQVAQLIGLNDGEIHNTLRSAMRGAQPRSKPDAQP